MDEARHYSPSRKAADSSPKCAVTQLNYSPPWTPHSPFPRSTTPKPPHRLRLEFLLSAPGARLCAYAPTGPSAARTSPAGSGPPLWLLASDRAGVPTVGPSGRPGDFGGRGLAFSNLSQAMSTSPSRGRQSGRTDSGRLRVPAHARDAGDHSGRGDVTDPRAQLDGAIRAMFESRHGARAGDLSIHPRADAGLNMAGRSLGYHAGAPAPLPSASPLNPRA